MLAVITSLLLSVPFGGDPIEVFESIYQTGLWGKNEQNEGTSGTRSEYSNAVAYVTYLSHFLKNNNIKSVVDAGCGDWRFSHLIDWDGIDYTGWDASETVIKRNLEKYADDNIKFVHGDFVLDDLPSADLLIIKDVFVHLSNDYIRMALRKFKNYKYVIVVNDVDSNTRSANNDDIKCGHWRPVDITAKPFNVKAQKEFIYKPQYSFGETKLVVLVKNEPN